jgi:glycosyltransferase involved in cell wall biosynthesis
VTSVIVPLVDSRHSVRSTVDALLAQSYRGLVEIILIGDRDEPAWTAIWREIESGQVQAIEVDGGESKRVAGAEAATGDVLCVVTDGVIPTHDWVAREVARSRDRAARRPIMHSAYQ